MKIVDLQPIPLVLPLPEAFLGGTYVIKARNTLVVRVVTDDGVVGETYGGDEDLYQDEIVRVITDYLRPMLLGQDPFMVEALNETMCSLPIDLGNRGLHALDLARHAIRMQAIAAVDIALWDVLGKAAGQPLYKLLGGFRETLPVISIGGYYSKDGSTTALADEVAECKARGVAGLKMKVGRATLTHDLERVRVVREAGGPDFVIACDANQGWSVADGIAFGRAVAPLNIAWLEEPVAWYDCVEGLRRVREATGLRVTSGQGEVSRQGMRDLIVRGAVDIINTDVTMVGGITQWRKIAGLAECFDLTIGHHEEPQVAAHLLASSPRGGYVEIFANRKRDPLWYELPEHPPRIAGGLYHVPQGPGLGLPLNQEVITRCRK
ncbi:MAG: mandelate racemase/muconate lactonizing enzyme family protein [Candidatus Latescibacteria bacterium]|nr:mandelate racemase/muconate lactonizing enzyme family protein [Candidatus Latescibacterota bacterium]